jgi:hypothetical protein
MYQDKLTLLKSRGSANAKTPVKSTIFHHQMELFSATPSSSTDTVAPDDIDASTPSDDVHSHRDISPDDDAPCALVPTIVTGASPLAHARGHDESPRVPAREHHDSPRARARVRPVRVTWTHSRARRHAANAELARVLMADDTEHTVSFLPHDYGARFDDVALGMPTLKDFFADSARRRD